MQLRINCMKEAKDSVTLMTTAEVAGYLRLKERTVYEMVARQQIPCSRATGKLLFSRPLIDAWVEAHTDMPPGRSPSPPRVYAGSSEPLLEWALRQSGSGLAVLIGGSRRGLELIARGEAVLAGVHLRDPDTGTYNVPQIRALVPQADIVAVHWATRTQGLLVAPGNPLEVAGLADAARRRLRLALRAPGSGSQVLLEALLAETGLALDDVNAAGRVAETQGDLAAMIAIGEADCGLGIAAAATGLGFLPLWSTDCFDLVLRRRDYFEPPFQALLAFARTEAFARQAAFLGGYDVAALGEVRFNA
jgi:putative molybdopterin biosynthesis protein